MKPNKLYRQDLKTQVIEELQRYIQQMDLTISTKLPREEALASMLGVSRITLRSALDDMAAEGLIFRRQGKGTFVNSAFFEINVTFSPVMHFSDMIRNSGYHPKAEILHRGIEKASDEVAKALQIEPGSEVVKVAKVFYADHSICAITEDYIPVSIIPAQKAEQIADHEDSLFSFLYHVTGHTIKWDKVQIDVASSASVSFLHDYLLSHGGKDKPLLLLKGVNYDEENREVLYACEYIDTSILKFHQIRRRSISFESRT